MWTLLWCWFTGFVVVLTNQWLAYEADDPEYDAEEAFVHALIWPWLTATGVLERITGRRS